MEQIRNTKLTNSRMMTKIYFLHRKTCWVSTSCLFRGVSLTSRGANKPSYQARADTWYWTWKLSIKRQGMDGMVVGCNNSNTSCHVEVWAKAHISIYVLGLKESMHVNPPILGLSEARETLLHEITPLLCQGRRKQHIHTENTWMHASTDSMNHTGNNP